MPPLPVVKGDTPSKFHSTLPAEISDSSDEDEPTAKQTKKRRLDAAAVSASPAVASDPIVRQFVSMGAEDLDDSSDDEVSAEKEASEKSSRSSDVGEKGETPEERSASREGKPAEDKSPAKVEKSNSRKEADTKDPRTQDPRRTRFGPPVKVNSL